MTNNHAAKSKAATPDFQAMEQNRGKYWLLDHCREGSGLGCEHPLGCPPNARFTLLCQAKPPKAYYKGPLSVSRAREAKAFLERCWGKNGE